MSEAVVTSDDMPATVSTETVAAAPGEVVVITVVGEIDMLTDPMLRKALDAALAQPVALPVVVDMFGVTFFSSSGISALAAARAGADEQGVSLRLVVMADSPPDRALHMMGMTQLLRIHRTRADAVAAASAGQ